MTYDAFNRLIKVQIDPDDDGTVEGSVLAAYQYDGNNRRIVEVTYLAGVSNTHLHQYYAGWSLIESRDHYGTQQLVTQYVWDSLAGHYIDSLAQIGHNVNGGDNTIDRKFYILQDQQFSVLAIIDTAGRVVESRDYGLYGSPRFYRRSEFDVRALMADTDGDYDVDDTDLSTAFTNYNGTGDPNGVGYHKSGT